MDLTSMEAWISFKRLIAVCTKTRLIHQDVGNSTKSAEVKPFQKQARPWLAREHSIQLAGNSRFFQSRGRHVTDASGSLRPDLTRRPRGHGVEDCIASCAPRDSFTAQRAAESKRIA